MEISISPSFHSNLLWYPINYPPQQTCHWLWIDSLTILEAQPKHKPLLNMLLYIDKNTFCLFVKNLSQAVA